MYVSVYAGACAPWGAHFLLPSLCTLHSGWQACNKSKRLYLLSHLTGPAMAILLWRPNLRTSCSTHIWPKAKPTVSHLFYVWPLTHVSLFLNLLTFLLTQNVSAFALSLLFKTHSPGSLGPRVSNKHVWAQPAQHIPLKKKKTIMLKTHLTGCYCVFITPHWYLEHGRYCNCFAVTCVQKCLAFWLQFPVVNYAVSTFILHTAQNHL